MKDPDPLAAGPACSSDYGSDAGPSTQYRLSWSQWHEGLVLRSWADG